MRVEVVTHSWRGNQDAYSVKEKKRCDDIEELADTDNVRIFYEEMWPHTEDFKTGAYSCRIQSCDLATDALSPSSFLSFTWTYFVLKRDDIIVL